jgi:hypothetical protein
MTKPISIMIGMPMYGGQCFSNCFISCIALTNLLRNAGIGFRIMHLTNESMITRARNQIAKQLMKSDCTHLLFIDADMGFDAEGVMRMIDADVDVLAAVYPKKSYDISKGVQAIRDGYPVEGFMEYCTTMTFYPHKDIDLDSTDWSKPVEVRFAGTGLMLIKREVFETMQPHVPSFVDDEDKDAMTHGYFLNDVDPDSGKMMGEDHYFCQKWREAGGKVHAAAWVVVNHMGTHVFNGPIHREPNEGNQNG